MRHVRMMKLVREPLFHFLALGGALFLLFGLVDDSAGTRADRIAVTADQIDRLAEGWERTWRRPPTNQELDGLIEDHVREEIYYREAVAMGLDRDDTVVRRRMRQKLEFLANDLLAAVDPTEEQLQGFLAENAEQFREADRLSFEHVYLNPDRRGEALYRDAENLLSRLETGGSTIDPAAQGDPFLLPFEYELVAEGNVDSIFGAGFADGLTGLSVGRWSGPIESGYGLHVVRLNRRVAGRAPPLEDARTRVEREWRIARQNEADKAFYRALRDRYSIIVEREVTDDGGTVEDVAEVRR